MTTRAEIAQWLDELYSPGSGPYTDSDKTYSHMIVACDTFDYEDYPVYVEAGKLQERLDEIGKDSFGKVIEVYSANYDRDAQLGERRAFHYD